MKPRQALTKNALSSTRGWRSVAGAALLLVHAALAAPVVLWVSEPVQPGQTALVFGDGFEGCRRVVAGGQAVQPEQVRPRSVKFVVPAALQPGVTPVEIIAPSGKVAFLLNRPALIWAQGDRGTDGSPGGFVRVVGKNLLWDGAQPRLRLGNTELKVTRSELFTLQAEVPAGLKPGAYPLTVHSGTGGEAGWSEPLSFTVVPKPSAPRIFPADKINGLDLDDDTPALQSALREAGAQGGGVVTLGHGRFVLSATLEIPPSVTLRGAGRELTALCWTASKTPPLALVSGTGQFGLEDLTLNALSYKHGIVSDQKTGGVTLRRLRLRLNNYRGHITPDDVKAQLERDLKLSTGGGDSLRLGGPGDEVADCDVYGSGRCLYLKGGRGTWIHDNQFSNGRWGWYSLSGNDGVIFERNEIRGCDLMSTGGGLNCLDGSMTSQNVYYAGNHLRDMYGWDREAMTSDAGGGIYYGAIESVRGAEVVLATNLTKLHNRDWRGAGFFILDGQGQGQYRRVATLDDRRITVESPWTIPPDRTSVVTITMLQRNYFFVSNRFEDAGVAIQLYGTSVGHISAGNVSARTAGFHNFGMNYSGIQPSWFIQWLGNRIEEGNVYAGGHDNYLAVGEAHLGVLALPPGVKPEAPLTLCGIVRGNRLENSAHLAIGGSDPPNPRIEFPYTQEVVCEQNHVAYADVGLVVARASAGVFTRENTFDHCRVNMADEAELDRCDRAERDALLAQPGPLLRLSFDRFEAGAYLDATGHGFDARPDGSVRLDTNGVRGSCARFDGASCLIVARPRVLQLTNFTVSAWVKPAKLEGRWGIASKRFRGSTAPFVLGATSGRLTFEAAAPDGKWPHNFSTAAALQAGQWQHVAVVFQEGEGTTLYLDGKPAGHRAETKPVTQNSEPLVLGREAWGGNPPKSDTPGFFTGCLDEVEVWGRPFSAEEIARLAQP